MSGGRKPRRPGPAIPPRAFRRRLSDATRRDLGLAHTANLDALATGDAPPLVLWELLSGALTWSRVAQRLGLGEPEMAAQMALVGALIERYGCTGRVAMTPQEYDLARAGVLVMDTLAEQVDDYTAAIAAVWSEEETQRMKRRYAQQEQAA